MCLDTILFGKLLLKKNYNFFTGVPCSFLKPLINFTINEANFIISTNEGEAVAISAGAFLSGKKSVVLMQNSGLTNAISPLTSLNHTFKIPVLGFVSLRGEPKLNDEPQHEMMGLITEKILDLISIKWLYLSSNLLEAEKQLDFAEEVLNSGQSFFFVVKKGVFTDLKLNKKEFIVNLNKTIKKKSTIDQVPSRISILKTINKVKSKDTAILISTGTSGRELYEIEDLNNNFYMVGSMGCVSSIGLGIVLNSNKKTIVIDGDGALLMRMGSLTTNAYYARSKELLHILLDNSSHESTGGQETVSNNVDFVQIAYSSGYSKSVYIHSEEELHTEYLEWSKNPMLTFFYIKIAKGSKENLGRPKVTPYEVKQRFMEFINA